jgi:hypothetical protein
MNRVTATAVVLALVAGMAGNFLALTMAPPRPDPFTGSMGRALKEELTQKIEALNKRVAELEKR